MPSLIAQKKNSVLKEPKKSLKTLTIDDYFFRSLEQDLKEISSGKKEIPKKPPVVIKPEITKPVPLQPEAPPPPFVKPPAPLKQIVPVPKKIKKTQEKELAEIEAAKKEKLVQVTKRQIKELFKQGKFYYKNKNFGRAIEVFQECLRLNPGFKKAKKYFLKSQKKLVASQEAKREELSEIQKKAREEAVKKAKVISKTKLEQELKVARIQAQAEIQEQMQQLESKIKELKQQRQAIIQQQAQETEELKRAEERKIEAEAMLQAQQEAQKQLEQYKEQQIGGIRKEISQEAQPELEKLKQQLAEQEKLFEGAQAQKQATEKQRQELQALTQEYEKRLRELQEQKAVPPTPDNLPVAEEEIAEPPPIKEPPAMVPEPTPLPPRPPQIIEKPLPEKPAEEIIKPQPTAPLEVPPPGPAPLTKPEKPVVLAPPALPRKIKPQPLPATAKPRPQIQLPKKAFSVKKVALALGGVLGISLIGLVIYWRFALKPTPPLLPPPPKKEPSLIIRFNRPLTDTLSWQKTLKTVIPKAINLPLENYQVDPVKDFNAWLSQEIFYLNFANNLSQQQITGVFILSISDKAQAQELFEKIKARQTSKASLENYHQYDIINCQGQFWAFADVFNLHYITLSQEIANLKLVLDYLNEKDLDFIESLEDKTSFWQGLAGTKINVWLDPENTQNLIKQALFEIELKIPWQVSENLKNYFTILVLDVLPPEESAATTQQTRTAAIFAFDDFDKINQAMLNWEKTMSHETAFLFWGLKPTPPTTLNFQGVIYNGAIIRFLMMPNDDLGIYYGLTKSNLILTNSENNVKLLLDYFSGN